MNMAHILLPAKLLVQADDDESSPLLQTRH